MSTFALKHWPSSTGKAALPLAVNSLCCVCVMCVRILEEYVVHIRVLGLFATHGNQAFVAGENQKLETLLETPNSELRTSKIQIIIVSNQPCTATMAR